MGELRDGIGCTWRQPAWVVHSSLYRGGIGRGRVNRLRPGNLFRQRRFILRIAPASVIGEQRDFVIFILPEEAKNVIGADFASRIDGKKFTGLNPEHSHRKLPGDCCKFRVLSSGGWSSACVIASRRAAVTGRSQRTSGVCFMSNLLSKKVRYIWRVTRISQSILGGCVVLASA